MTDARMLRKAIDKSGLSARQFAEIVMGRNERTIRRWLAGDSAIPVPAVDWLRRYLKGEITVEGTNPDA
jgi:hypothetical protein